MVLRQKREHSQELLRFTQRLIGVKEWGGSGFGTVAQRRKFKDMKKNIILIVLLCVVIIGFTILNNISFNDETLSKKSTELLKDSILLRQAEMQDLMLRKTSVLDSMSSDNKTSNSVIQEEIQKIRVNSDEILKFQKIYQNSKK